MSDRLDREHVCENTLLDGPEIKPPVPEPDKRQIIASHEFDREYWRCLTVIGAEQMRLKLASLTAQTERRIAKG